MLYLQSVPVQAVRTPAVTTATNATNVSFIDTRANGGANEVLFQVSLGPASASNVSASFATLNVVESDTTDQTAFTTILQGTSGTPTASQFQLAVHNNTSLEQVNLLSVPVLGRKRYLGVVATPNSSNNRAVGVVAITGPRINPQPADLSSGVAAIAS